MNLTSTPDQVLPHLALANGYRLRLGLVSRQMHNLFLGIAKPIYISNLERIKA